MQSYEEAFDAEEPAATAVDDDAAFGLVPDAEETGAMGDDTNPAVAVIVDTGAEDTAAPAEEPAAIPGDDVQREKSWEGRLNAREEELRKREEALNERGTESPAEEAAEQGEMDMGGDLEAAIKMLSEDFGPEFVKAVQMVAQAAAGGGATEGSPKVEDVIGEIENMKARMHFERIFDSHPDFMEVAASPEFTAWVGEDPDKQEVVNTGSARAVVALLDAFKKSASEPEAAAGGEDEMAAADGVASSGLRLPESGPAAPGSYEDAWDQA